MQNKARENRELHLRSADLNASSKACLNLRHRQFAGPSPEKAENVHQKLENNEFLARTPKSPKMGFRSSKIANFGPEPRKGRKWPSGAREQRITGPNTEKPKNGPQELENSEFRARAPKRQKMSLRSSKIANFGPEHGKG